MFAQAALPPEELLPQRGKAETAKATGETTPGEFEEAHWEVVAIARGLAEAAIIRGRLEAEGIPARVHQEAAGKAIGLTVGLLGQIKVLAPEPLVESALDILSQENEALDEHNHP